MINSFLTSYWLQTEKTPFLSCLCVQNSLLVSVKLTAYCCSLVFHGVGLLVHCICCGSREMLRTYLKSN